MNASEINALSVGDFLESTFDVEPFTRFQKLKAGARFGEPRKVVAITARGISVDGKAYVLGETEHGPNATITFSIGEGELLYRKAR